MPGLTRLRIHEDTDQKLIERRKGGHGGLRVVPLSGFMLGITAKTASDLVLSEVDGEESRQRNKKSVQVGLRRRKP